MDSPGAAAADAWNKPPFVVWWTQVACRSRGRRDANDSAEAAHRCRAALGSKESRIKADHSGLIGLSNLCRCVGGGGAALSREIFGNLHFQGS